MIIAGTLPEPRGDLRAELLRADFSEAELNEFSIKLRDSDPLSIDTFLEGNTYDRFQEIGKAAIAITILRAEQSSRDGEKFMGRNVPDDHWLRYVWNLVRSGCTSPDMFAENKLSVVTFNYDRTVEWYFPIVLQNAFNLRPDEARALFAETIRVVHLHGQIAERAFGQYAERLAGVEVKRVAAGIRVVHDPASERPFAEAWDLFKQARLLCILGFGYHPVNIERLRVKDHLMGGIPIAASTFDMGQAEVRVATGRMERDLYTMNRNDLKAERFLREAAQLA